jgi:hypothetical protein
LYFKSGKIAIRIFESAGKTLMKGGGNGERSWGHPYSPKDKVGVIKYGPWKEELRFQAHSWERQKKDSCRKALAKRSEFFHSLRPYSFDRIKKTERLLL